MTKENIQNLKWLVSEKLNGNIVCFLEKLIIIRLDNDAETEYCLTSLILKELLDLINPTKYYFSIVQNDTTNYVPYLDLSFHL